jgi:hypothetical protein
MKDSPRSLSKRPSHARLNGSLHNIWVKGEMGGKWRMRRFRIKSCFKILFLATLFLFMTSYSWAQEDRSSQPEEQPGSELAKQPENEPEKLPEKELETRPEIGLEKEPQTQPEDPAKKREYLTRGQKTLLLNVGGMGAIFLYGLKNWDYGKSSFNTENERWFQRDTQYGGADKLGHFWSSYALSHAISYAYRRWGYTKDEANVYGALSNLGMQTFMEIADGFSSQGFSYEDMLMNILGSAVAYIWGRSPSLARKIDFRMEYTPEFSSNDFEFSTNYERQRFLMAVKADGFDIIRNPYLRYLEFQVGYYTRGYKGSHEGAADDRRRHLYVGLGINVGKLAQEFTGTKILNYIQIPYTSATIDVASDPNRH